MKINGLIVAAGLSSRMGDTGFKPLLPLRGKTIIETTIDSMLHAGAEQVVIVLGYRAEEIKKVLLQTEADKRGQLLFAYNHNPMETDMLFSIQSGLAAMPICDAFFLLPGDMPLVADTTFLELLQVREQTGASLVFPCINGRRKHPPLIDYHLIPLICSYTGENGLRGVWIQYETQHPEQIREIAVTDQGCMTDIDTSDDYHRITHKKEVDVR